MYFIYLIFKKTYQFFSLVFGVFPVFFCFFFPFSVWNIFISFYVIQFFAGIDIEWKNELMNEILEETYIRFFEALK